MNLVPDDVSPADQAELDCFATELRESFPESTLSDSFHQQLALKMQSTWSFRSALRSNTLMRVAAGLLMISVVAAPVAAIMVLMQAPEVPRRVLGFEPANEALAEEIAQLQQDETGYTIVGPEDELDLPGVGWSSSRMLVLEQSNRLALAAMSWHRADVGLEPNPGASDLWAEFLLSCSKGTTSVPDESLWDSLKELQASASRSPREATALAAWTWVRDGATVSMVEAPLAWASAPFVHN